MTRRELVAELERCLARRRQLEWQLFVVAPAWQRDQLARELAQVKQEHGRLEARLKRFEMPASPPPIPSRAPRPLRPFRLVLLGLTLGLMVGWLSLSNGLFSFSSFAAGVAVRSTHAQEQPAATFARTTLDNYTLARLSNNLDQAISLGEQLKGTVAPEDLAALYKQRALQRLAGSDYTGALADFQQQAALLQRRSTPLTAEDYFNQGRAYLGLQQNEPALKAFVQAIARDGNYSPAYYYAGLTSVNLHDYVAATGYYRQVVQFGQRDRYYEDALVALSQLGANSNK